jgi:tetratricopeptide (TPR) repeat protein
MADLGERTVLWIRSVPELDASQPSHAPWLMHIRACVETHAGQVEIGLGLCQVVSFDGLDLEAAVSCALELVAEARGFQPHYTVHIGLALGEVSRPESAPRPYGGGAAWDRAQTLSHRARPYEIVFDEVAEQRGQEKWLFAREVGGDRVQGYVLEPEHFSKVQCRQALQQLRSSALPHSTLLILDELLALRARPGQQRVLLRAFSEVAAYQCIERLMAHRPPPLLLVVGSNAGCLRPLGSLALALRRAWPSEQAFAEASLQPAHKEHLHALMHGAAVQRADIATALSDLLHAYTTDDDRPHIVFEQLTEVDPASLAVLAEVLMAPETAAFVLLTLSREASAPAQLLTAHELHELHVPLLALEERAAMAGAALSRPATDELAVRIAALGGPDGFGLVEALRTLISSGDLIWDGQTFDWRDGPRQGAGIVPVEALITERVAGLPEAAYRVLEAICCAPRQMGKNFVCALALRDGLDEATFESGVTTLQHEAWVDETLDLGAIHATVRTVLRNLIPPARAAELHGYAAQIARAYMPEPCFGSGEIAYHLFEAGALANAARALVEAAHAAMDMGFQRMALRLLATAVEWEPSTQIRKAARALARSVRPPAPPPALGDGVALRANELERAASADGAAAAEPDGPSTTMGQSALRLALAALTRRDFEATERWLDAMLADGGSLAPALRVLALSHLMRGDPDSAVAVLQRQHADEAPASTRARDMLCWGLVRLAQGDPSQAIRMSLASLALARQRTDLRGEAAALQVMSFAYRSLDRDEDALQLEAAATARLQDHMPGVAAV